MKTTIILLHHTGTLINKCLESLQNTQSDKIIVTSDTQFQWHKHSLPNGIRVFTNTLNEPAHKRNYGANIARSYYHSDYYCFMDDDTYIEPDCIKNMESFLDYHANVGMVYAKLLKPNGEIDNCGSYLSSSGFLIENAKESIYPYSVLAGKSACCMIRADLFHKLYFDDDFVIYGEETDLSWRVWWLGYKVMLLPQDLCYHIGDTQEKPKSYHNQHWMHYHGSKNYITMLIKNLEWSSTMVIIKNIAVWLVMACLFMFKKPKTAKWILQGIFYNVVNLRHILAKCRQTKRAVSQRQLFKYILYNPPITYYLNRFKEYLFHPNH